MPYAELRTEDLPAPERFNRWYDFRARAHPPVGVSIDEAADFRATARILDLDGVVVSAMTHPPLRVVRTSPTSCAAGRRRPP